MSGNTLLLLHGETLVDSSGYNRTITNSGVTVSDAKSKFGSKSLYFNGSSYLQIPLVVSGEITIDFWVYTTGFATAYPTPVDFAQDSERGITLHLSASKVFLCGKKSSDLTTQIYTTYTAVPANEWHHIAVTRQGNTLKAYTDGVLQTTLTNTDANLSRVFIGGVQDKSSGEFFTGYIDEFRISNVVRWSSDFAPPTEPYVGGPSEPVGDHNTLNGGVARGLESMAVLFGGVSREIDSGITLVGGVAREISFVTGEPIGNLAVGASVYTPVNGVIKEFIVVHQGKPSSMYDSSCNGTWLLSKDIYTTSKWHSTTYGDYKSSTIHTYLKNTFLNLLDDDIKAQIKTVKIPYINRNSATGSVKIESGSNGLSVQIFLLSVYEVGFTSEDSYYIPDADGVKLDYFGSGTDSTSLKKRIAYLNGTAGTWWLRTAYTFNTSSAWSVNASGRHAGDVVTASKGVRPALILPQSALVNSNFQIIG